MYTSASREGRVMDSVGKGHRCRVRMKLIYWRDPLPISSKVGIVLGAERPLLSTLAQRVEVDLEDVKLAR